MILRKKGRYYFYDDNHKIIIVTSDRNIGADYAEWKRNLRNEKRTSTQEA